MRLFVPILNNLLCLIFRGSTATCKFVVRKERIYKFTARDFMWAIWFLPVFCTYVRPCTYRDRSSITLAIIVSNHYLLNPEDWHGSYGEGQKKVYRRGQRKAKVNGRQYSTWTFLSWFSSLGSSSWSWSWLWSMTGRSLAPSRRRRQLEEFYRNKRAMKREWRLFGKRMASVTNKG